MDRYGIEPVWDDGSTCNPAEDIELSILAADNRASQLIDDNGAVAVRIYRETADGWILIRKMEPARF